MPGATMEWVPGDRFWAKVPLLLLFLGLALLIIIAVSIDTALPFLVGIPTALAVFAMVGVVFLFLYLPRFRPVVERINVSPAGLTLVFSLHVTTHPWSTVSWVQPTCIEVPSRTGRTRVRLTTAQADRVRRFLRSS